MNCKISKLVGYLSTYRDVNGHFHYSVNYYDRITGFITTFQDYIFSFKRL